MLNGYKFLSMMKHEESDLNEIVLHDALQGQDSADPTGPPDVYQQLLEAYLDRDVETFKDVLDRGLAAGQFDPNHWYDADNGTVLDVVCRMPIGRSYVSSLFRAGSNLDKVSTYTLRKLMFLSLEIKDIQMIEVVLKDPRTDPNTPHRLGYAPLHYAAMMKSVRFVEELLKHPETDINKTDQLGMTALHWAAGGGDLDVLERLMQTAERPRELINSKNLLGDTPLHYATKRGDHRVILYLLQQGASIAEVNNQGQPAFAGMMPKILERFLDQCIVTNDKLSQDKDFEIIFKSKLLAPSIVRKHVYAEENKKKTSMSDTEALLYMSRRPELRALLKHPTLASFIKLKWEKVKKCFFFNLTLYTQFCFLLNAHIILPICYQTGSGQDIAETKCICERDSKIILENTTNGQQFNTNNMMFGVTPEIDESTGVEDQIKNSVVGVMIEEWLIIILILLILRETVQSIITPVQYVLSVENWMEIILFGITIIILSGNNTAPLSAVAIFLSWVEFIILIGRHPVNATSMEMFKTVSWNYIKYLAWYSILIMAFSLSFFVLMWDWKTNYNNFFSNPVSSMFKSIVMMTGEFEVSNIPFEAHPIVSYVLFLLFVFMIAIVLLNLLNGLAVNDTQTIRNEAKVLSYASQVKFVSYFENMVVENHKPFLNTFSKIVGRCLKTINSDIFNIPPNDYEIHVLPNQGNMIKIKNKYCGSKKKTIMDSVIVEEASRILIQRTEENVVDEKWSALEEIKTIQDELKNEIKEIRCLLNEIITGKNQHNAICNTTNASV